VLSAAAPLSAEVAAATCQLPQAVAVEVETPSAGSGAAAPPTAEVAAPPAPQFHMGAAPAATLARVQVPSARDVAHASMRRASHTETKLLRMYRRAQRVMARSRSCPFQCDAAGVERMRTAHGLTTILQRIADHAAAHLGVGYDVHKLAFVREARKRVTRVLEGNNLRRACAIHDARMFEGYLCLNTAYAADSWLAAQTGVGEVHGTRASCVFLHLRKHWTKSDGEGGGWTWSRLGKSNHSSSPPLMLARL
jgi:hypothetical protein